MKIRFRFRSKVVPVHKERVRVTSNTFSYLLLLTLFFLLLEISFFIQCNKGYLSDVSFEANQVTIPFSVLPDIFFFVLAQLMIRFLYCVLAWFVASALSHLFSIKDENRLKFAITIWLLGMITVLVANQYYYPNSQFAGITAVVLFHAALLHSLFIFLLSLCAICFLFSFAHLIKILPRWFSLLVVFISLSAWFAYSNRTIVFPLDGATRERPNVILIGVDSLRPDFVGFFNGSKKTPFMDQFLEHGVVFSEAVTPLARTFPSWTSILAGKYPRATNVRSNLQPPEKIKLSQTLPGVLRQHGYQTIYATDETRFSNIDHYFGFDHIVSPPVGLNDFIIGTFNDFPLSNLLINTTLGKWLFPYSYGNRPVYYTYDPNSFLKLLEPKIPGRRTQPLFLAVHFCLPHGPYLWSSLQESQYPTAQERYEQSIRRVDQQLSDFVAILKEKQMLKHAIVVLLSDHGEALEWDGDRITEKESFIEKTKTVPHFYPPGLNKQEVNQSAGHGTDVLGLTQHHSLLAFQLRGTGKAQASIQRGVVSLMDIMPTVLDLVGLSGVAPASQGSESLLNQMMGQRRGVAIMRHIFLESDYSPEAIRTVYPDTHQVLLEGAGLFKINPFNLRLLVKEEMEEMIIHSKQYADIYDGWVLALYPQGKTHRMPILVNLNSGDWTNDLHSPFAQHSPALYMLEALRRFYGAEIGEVS